MIATSLYVHSPERAVADGGRIAAASRDVVFVMENLARLTRDARTLDRLADIRTDLERATGAWMGVESGLEIFFLLF